MRDERDNREQDNLGDLNLDGEANTDTNSTNNRRSANKAALFTLIVVAAAAAGGAWYFLSYKQQQPVYEPQPLTQPLPQPTLAPPPTPSPEPTPEVTPTPTQAIEPEPTPTPLPTLNESDDAVRAALTEQVSAVNVGELLTSDEIVRKFVRAIYSLNKGKVVPQYRPLNGPDSPFKAQAIGRMAVIADPKNPGESLQTAVFRNPTKNQQRYTTYIQLLNSLNAETITTLYQYYYPLLQQAYQELGEGPEQFHTVALKALDILLTTPNPEQEPELILTSVQYQYLDPELEALPNAQKLVLRMGYDNRTQLLKKLSDLRKALQRLTF